MRAPVGGRGDLAFRADLWRRGFEIIAADEEHVDPGGVGIVKDHPRIGRGRQFRVRAGGRSDGRRVGQDLLHPCIRIERLALHDADGGERPHDLRIEGVRRLLLHQLVDHLEVAEVVRRNGVHHLAGAFGELHRLLGCKRPSPVCGPECAPAWPYRPAPSRYSCRSRPGRYG